MFSITTMASSTTSPVAKTSASRVRILMEKSIAHIAASVPTNARGIATAGISVAAGVPKNSQRTSTTIAIVSSRLITTSVTAPRINWASSEVLIISRLSKRWLSRSNAASTLFEISIVFEPAWRTIPKPTTARPSNLEKDDASSGPKKTWATSFMRTVSRIMMSPI